MGGLKVLRRSDADVATVVGGGVTVFEALKAYEELQTQGASIRVVDLYSLQPIDAAALLRCAKATNGRVGAEQSAQVLPGITVILTVT